MVKQSCPAMADRKGRGKARGGGEKRSKCLHVPKGMYVHVYRYKQLDSENASNTFILIAKYLNRHLSKEDTGFVPDNALSTVS